MTSSIEFACTFVLAGSLIGPASDDLLLEIEDDDNDDNDDDDDGVDVVECAGLAAMPDLADLVDM